MPTPESIVKRQVSKLLSSYAGLYYEMPVPGGYGKSGLDYTCCCKGHFFAIETKAPGKEPTLRQTLTIQHIREAGGTVFVIDGPKCVDFGKLILFLEALTGNLP